VSALSPTAFRTRYPAFDAATYPDPIVQLALDDVALEMDVTQWARLFDRGAYALCAHLLTVSVAGSSPIGGIQSRSIGDVSVTFAKGASALDEMGSTQYGAEFVRLRNLVSGGAAVI
jgi:hypothetical protein